MSESSAKKAKKAKPGRKAKGPTRHSHGAEGGRNAGTCCLNAWRQLGRYKKLLSRHQKANVTSAQLLEMEEQDAAHVATTAALATLKTRYNECVTSLEQRSATLAELRREKDRIASELAILLPSVASTNAAATEAKTALVEATAVSDQLLIDRDLLATNLADAASKATANAADYEQMCASSASDQDKLNQSKSYHAACLHLINKLSADNNHLDKVAAAVRKELSVAEHRLAADAAQLDDRTTALNRRLQDLVAEVDQSKSKLTGDYDTLNRRGKKRLQALLSTAVRDHTEELMIGLGMQGTARTVTLDVDGCNRVLIDDQADDEPTGVWNKASGRWDFHNDSLPVMAVLAVRDSRNVSNSTTRALSDGCGLKISGHKAKIAEREFNDHITKSRDEGGLGLTVRRSDPDNFHHLNRATVQVSVIDYLSALLLEERITVGPPQRPYTPPLPDGVEEKIDAPPEHRYLDLNFSGDGRNMTKGVKNVQLSFSCLNEGRSVALPSKQYCLGIMDGDEDYDALKYNFKPLLDEIARIDGTDFKDPKSGVIYRIRSFLSGDWKFLRIVMGLAAPNQHDFCMWCSCTKDSIADVTQTWKITRNAEARNVALDGLASEAPELPVVARNLDEFKLPPRSEPDKRKERMRLIITGAHSNILREIRASYNLGTSSGDNKEWNITNISNFLTGPEKDMPDKRVLYVLDTIITKQEAHKQSLAEKHDIPHHGGYIQQSLFPTIPFERLILDVLHAFLRIYDVMFGLLVEDAARIGIPILRRLENEIRHNCGIGRFKFDYGDYDGDKARRKLDPDSRASKIITFTDLDGNEKLRILRKIVMSNVFKEQEGVDVGLRVKIWKDFGSIYHHLSSWVHEIPPDEYRKLCTEWMKTFLTVSSRETGDTIDGIRQIAMENGQSLYVRGYFCSDITPYIHALCSHSWEMRRRWSSIQQFACFALEKSNHIQQSQWHSACNHGGGKKLGEMTFQARLHFRSQTAYGQIILQHFRMAFNKSVRPAKYPCGQCTSSYQTAGWAIRHWVLHHAPAGTIKSNVDVPFLLETAFSGM